MAASQSGRTSGLAQRYASALFDLADEEKALDAVAADMRALRSMLGESEDLRRLVRSPVLKREDQVRALRAVAERSGFSSLTANFLGVVAKNRRLFALEGMAEAFLQLLASRRGEVTAFVSSAQPLSEAQQAEITDVLKRVVGSKVAIDATVDPSLLGGLLVRVGSRLFDNSLKTKLQRLQVAMKGVG